MDLNEAIQKHAQWKFKFTAALRSNEALDAATIAKDNYCEFGKWLHEDAKFVYQALPSYSSCVANHAAFHREAGKVAAAINAKKPTEAERMMGPGTPFTVTSKAVAVAIIELQQQMKK